MAKGDNGKMLDENHALMTNGKTKNEEKKKFSSFIYNKQKGTFLGRTAKSWCHLLIFYVIFYICLAAFWIGCLAIFLKTIDPNIPRYYGKGTIIGTNPGVGFHPLLKDDPESTLIRFNPNKSNSYNKYVDTMDKYLMKYSNTNHTRLCTVGQTNSDVVKNGKAISPDAESCRFSLDIFDRNGCSAQNKYGYPAGQPCVILSLNRLIDWKPQDFEDGKVPTEISSRYKKGVITFNCDGNSESDQEYIGKVEYLPSEGIDGRYYPYAMMSNYHQPIAMVKFTSLPRNRVVMVVCRAYARNIEQDLATKLGMATFELFISTN